MKVLIITHGTRGDVQPYVALARALDTAGHQVVLAAPARSRGLVEPTGVDFAPLDDGPTRLLADPRLREGVGSGFRGVRGARVALEVVRRSKPLMRAALDDAADAARGGADVVVHSPILPGHQIAEWLGVPAVPAVLQPTWVPTKAFPVPGGPPIPRLPGPLNRASYRLSGVALHAFASVVDPWRAEVLGLGRRRGRHGILHGPDGRPATVLQGFSPLVPPGPPDYPEHVHTTGYWFLPAVDWVPPPELTAFLAAGPPPVYVGFGSMAGSDPQHSRAVVTEAVYRSRVRAVVAAGWGGIAAGDPGGDVLYVDQVPHDWLFPRCAAVVHHGGAGTTGAALASGRPQVVCPFTADQPFWAERMYAIGVAPPPQPQYRLTAAGLAEAIGRATAHTRLSDRARVIGGRIRAEPGTAAAVDVVEAVAAGR